MVKESSDEEVLATEEPAPYEDNIYVSRFSKDDDYLLSVSDDFYEQIAWNPIERKHGVDDANSTWDAVQNAYKSFLYTLNRSRD